MVELTAAMRAQRRRSVSSLPLKIGWIAPAAPTSSTGVTVARAWSRLSFGLYGGTLVTAGR